MTDSTLTLPMLADRDRRRVVAAAALMTSDKDGEALAAVRATCRMLAPHGVGIADLIAAALSAGALETARRNTPEERPSSPRPAAAPSWGYMSSQPQRMARMCLMQSDYLNAWERGFLNSIVRESSLTRRQQDKLDAIVAKIDEQMKERNDGGL